MWVIVAMTIGLGGDPRLTAVPGQEFRTEADCVRATHVRANVDTDHAENSKIALSFCVPEGSVKVGAADTGAATPPAAPPGKKTDTK
jgi:hypothetical protein